ncbi:MAG TPA: hypothetical protein VGO11_27035 [Chthoniobacteraceae bacterium]|jgi:hypothetical protein|nr:hypothetical protein [Chthoniobacteraceae bacterium]
MAPPADDEIDHNCMPRPDGMAAGSVSSLDSWERNLAAMAANPEIETELRRIESEFALTEMDGLEQPDVASE